MIKSKVAFVIVASLGVLSLVVFGMMLPILPEQVPVHWNLYSQRDGWLNKNIWLVLTSVPVLLSVGMLVFLYKKEEATSKWVKAVTLTGLVVMIRVNWLIAVQALGHHLQAGMVVSVLSGLLLIVIGNYLPQVRQNLFIGVRTPWTLKNSFVWQKTNRVGGSLYVINGFLLMILGVLQNTILAIVALACLVLVSIGLIVYSYLIYKKSRGEEYATN